MEDDFDANFDAGIETMKRTPEGRADLGRIAKEDGGLAAKKAREKQSLLTALGFTASDAPDKSIQLVPRRHYDLRIDTSDHTLGSTPAERGNAAAKRILCGSEVK